MARIFVGKAVALSGNNLENTWQNLALYVDERAATNSQVVKLCKVQITWSTILRRKFFPGFVGVNNPALGVDHTDMIGDGIQYVLMKIRGSRHISYREQSFAKKAPGLINGMAVLWALSLKSIGKAIYST